METIDAPPPNLDYHWRACKIVEAFSTRKIALGDWAAFRRRQQSKRSFLERGEFVLMTLSSRSPILSE